MGTEKKPAAVTPKPPVTPRPTEPNPFKMNGAPAGTQTPPTKDA
ncbi:hypothetical protein GCM10009775_21130 [Microbacterium aoyamense]|uniref:Uncharacterized protein n=1 Tax=Microbacterium aoyamense TaxID=344166 RepID=A0ABN2PQ99_9MICO|nr:hypothetical protein [Microbacterium aoyamense]